jgi:hypothetical protein
MSTLIFRNIRSQTSKEIEYPFGVPLPRAGDEIVSPLSGRRVFVTKLVGGNESPLEVWFSE